MASTFQIVRNDHGRLVLKRAGQDDAVDVRIRRAFPWANPGRFISIRSGEGRELLLIEDMESLDADQRRLIEQSLAETSFIPRITRIEAIDLSFDHQQWKVQTDRGAIEFRVKEREDIRFLNDGRFSVKDVDGNVYELPALDSLDESSRSALERLV